jgi:glucose/mannose-6-phosphate isomerase
MYNRIFDFPEQLEDAMRISSGWKVHAEEFTDIRNIVVVGMGGSAIGGDLVRSYLSGQLLVPMQVCRNYSVPEYVDDESLVIVSSYSGNTEETLAALDDALNRKAMIVALTTGGMVGEVAKLNDIPCAQLPPGIQPRAALGYSFVPLLLCLEKVGLIKGMEDELKKVIKHLSALRSIYIEDNPLEQNKAKNLADRILGKMAIIYSGPSLTDVVAVRWKGQLCENSKNMAFANQFPEMNHNELVAFCELIMPYKDELVVFMLRDKDDHPKVQRRMEIVKSIIEAQEIETVFVDSAGETPLERMFSLVQLGDFISYYLAVINDIDPTPVEAIETLKKQLAES